MTTVAFPLSAGRIRMFLSVFRSFSALNSLFVKPKSVDQTSFMGLTLSLRIYFKNSSSKITIGRYVSQQSFKKYYWFLNTLFAIFIVSQRYRGIPVTFFLLQNTWLHNSCAVEPCLTVENICLNKFSVVF